MPDAEPALMTIFAEALERTDPAARAAYLDGACRDDAALRRRVEALLAAHDGAGRFLEGQPTGMSEPTSPETSETTRASDAETRFPSELATVDHKLGGSDSTITGAPRTDRPGGSGAGQVIAGRYTLLDVLGEGGMGTVYRADQTEPVRRQVALKLIKIGMDSRAVLARFDAERQALALMDHPNIARVYDGGTTAAGQPFNVMELVSGVPITGYCDRHRLSVRARLELCVSVCVAVQHAHQKGIIHRDLKPGNVLVTEVDGRPTPKVIDFGVAKATEFKLTDQSLADAGAIVGTPAYMSPQQADPSSMDIDTRTDVYALGVILYELLAGSPPIDAKQFQRGAFLEMLRMVREVDPPGPSTKVSTSEALPSIAASRDIEPSRLKQLLRGDLDWIAMKALEKDRARRYETANAFAADVLRHLAYEPVLAAPPSRAYRLRKFVRKHRGAVVAANLVILALLVGMAGTTWGLIRAQRARADEAKRGRERDEALVKANNAKRTADARADELTYRLGVSDMVLAVAAYDNGDVFLAAERLDKVPSAQRGWEWHYLKRLTRGGLFTLYGHTGALESVAFSPDGARILTSSDDGTVKMWDARTGTSWLQLEGSALGAAFSPDGTGILTGSGDNTAKVWDARSGRLRLDLKGHTGGLWKASFSADGTRIVGVGGAWSSLREVKVLDAQTGAPLLELTGHTLPVMSVAFSPDGTRIVTGCGRIGLSAPGEVKVWDARTGTPLLELKGHALAVMSVAFSPDGTRIVAGGGFLDGMGFPGETNVWDARTGTHLLELKGHTAEILSVAFSPDGTRILTGSNDRTARVWDARTGAQLLELRGHTSEVRSVAFSPDGTRVLTGSSDQTAKVWDARSGARPLEVGGHSRDMYNASFSRYRTRMLSGSDNSIAKQGEAQGDTEGYEPKGDPDWVTTAAFSPDGGRLVTAGGAWFMPREVNVWDVRSGTRVLELKGHKGRTSSASFSPDGARIVTASDDGTAKVWDARTGTPLLDLKGHKGVVWSASFSPDGTRIVTGGADETARVWDAPTGTPLLDLEGHTGVVWSASFSPDGARIVTAGGPICDPEGEVKLWDAASGAQLLDLKGHLGEVYVASFSPDGARIVSGSADRTAKVWDARSGAKLLELRGHAGGVMSAAFSPDGTRIVTGGGPSAPGEVKVWDAGTGTPLLELKPHTETVMSVAFSPDGTRIVTASYLQMAKVWYARPAPPPVDLKGDTIASFSPDGRQVVTGGLDGTATVLDARTATSLVELEGHTGSVMSASFSPDGTRIVTGSVDDTARVWDARTGTSLLELKGHTSGVSSVSFSPDGTRIVTGSSDKTAKVWDARSGRPLLELKGHSDKVSRVWFSPDGTRVATGGSDHALKVWDARTGRELKGAWVPSRPRDGQISPDGRWIAYIFSERVQLIPLQPDEEELSYRRLLMQPNYEFFREAYDAATKANDAFVASFYLNLFPAAEQIRIQAETTVTSLFDRLLLRDDVLAALKAQPAADREIQAACLKLARTLSESAEDCNSAGWDLLRDPGRQQADYRRGLRLAQAACRLEPEGSSYLNTLGVAQYRCGLMAEALATLKRSNDLNTQREPADLAFLALAQQRLGQSDEARVTLSRLREVMKDPRWAGDSEAQAFLREAEMIELDRVFPADPFAP